VATGGAYLGHYYCSAYTPSGKTLLRGKFQESIGEKGNPPFYFGFSVIHWNGVVLDQVALDCFSGGKYQQAGVVLPDCN
jgi:hypothetical protein